MKLYDALRMINASVTIEEAKDWKADTEKTVNAIERLRMRDIPVTDKTIELIEGRFEDILAENEIEATV